uniref:Uncharacterized protein n=1 Tax=Callithrix jacchus TaxID=9483 RepID=A0A8I3WK21_CALJA
EGVQSELINFSSHVYGNYFSRHCHIISIVCHKNLVKFKHYNFLLVCFLRQSLTLFSRLEFSGAISVHCNLHFLGSSNSAASTSRVAGITGACHNTGLIFIFLVETQFHHIQDQPQTPDFRTNTKNPVRRLVQLQHGWQ